MIEHRTADVNAGGLPSSPALPEPADGCLRIPEGTEYVLEESYHGREDIIEVFFPSTMRVIGPIAFAECPGLRRIHLNEGLSEIGDGAFLGAELLREVHFPDSLRVIGPMAFWSCGIETAVIPSSVVSIGESAFWDCRSLQRCDVLNPDAFIDRDAFGDCPQLVRGYMAPGFPAEATPPSELLFSLLWASECDRHPSDGETARRAKHFIGSNPSLIVEHIIRAHNAAAMKGLVRYGLLDAGAVDAGLRLSVEAGLTELSSLFLAASAAATAKTTEKDEFEL